MAGYKPCIISTIVDLDFTPLHFTGYKPCIISTIVDSNIHIILRNEAISLV